MSTQTGISPKLVNSANDKRQDALQHDYEALGNQLARQGLDIEQLTEHAAGFSTALPSWGVGTGCTRFARFPGPGEPRNIYEKVADCGVIQQLSQATPAISLHIPWDTPN